MPIRAVLFDFGGVYTSSPFALFTEAASELGVTPEHLLGLVFGPCDRHTDHPWPRLERGELSLAEARQSIMALASESGLAFDPLAILARMARTGGAREAVVEATRRLRARGLRTALITNNAREFSRGWRA